VPCRAAPGECAAHTASGSGPGLNSPREQQVRNEDQRRELDPRTAGSGEATHISSGHAGCRHPILPTWDYQLGNLCRSGFRMA
jgi:hypothetical protein